MQFALPLSSLPGIAWPALPEPAGTAQLALLYQLQQSEQWPPEQLASVQYRQLSELLNHAWKTSSFYRSRLDAAGYKAGSAISPGWFSSLPLLTRQELQANFDALKSTDPPKAHGPINEGTSSGSTGRPIRFLGTEYTRTLWRTLALRDHLWNERDFSGRVAIIRAKETVASSNDWGPPLRFVYPSSPCPLMDISAPIHEQAKWLLEQQPDYLLTFPSNLNELAKEVARSGSKLTRLKQIITLGETLADEVRSACESIFQVPIRDIYSASEVGHIALQCSAGHYHLQENLLVEILDESGHPVAPGESGRVIITDLHNFALPLIRYALGDYAEKGGNECACGRRTTQLNRILGRSRNMLTFPNGNKAWPSFPAKLWLHIAPVKQIQLVQTAPDSICIRLSVPGADISESQRQNYVKVFQELLGYPFSISFEVLENFQPNPNNKFEDFISNLA